MKINKEKLLGFSLVDSDMSQVDPKVSAKIGAPGVDASINVDAASSIAVSSLNIVERQDSFIINTLDTDIFYDIYSYTDSQLKTFHTSFSQNKNKSVANIKKENGGQYNQFSLSQSFGKGGVDGDSKGSEGFKYNYNHSIANISSYNPEKELLWGGFVSVGSTEVEADGNNSAQSKSNDFRVGFFAKNRINSFMNGSALAAGSYSHLDLERPTAIGQADGKTNAYGVSAFLDLEVSGFSFFDRKVLVFPYVNMNYRFMSVQDFSEKGGAAAHVDLNDSHQFISNFGIKVKSKYKLYDYNSELTLRLGWQHEYLGEQSISVSNLLPNAIPFLGNGPFVNKSPEIDPDTFDLSIAYGVTVSENIVIEAFGSAKYNSQSYDSSAMLKVIYKW